ncbi:MAG: aldo/keto reductase [Solitalea sp.]
MATRRSFGNSSLQVSPLAFGGNVFGWTLNESESFRILDAFLDAGFNFIDTADTYSKWAEGNQGGESETILGNWFRQRGRRDDVILATKLGGDMGAGRKGLKAGYVKEAVEASLKRLKTDYIDLYQTHYDDPETPVEETMEALNRLIDEGKVRYIGASNYTAERIAQSNEFARQHGMQGYISLQPLYNLHDRQQFEESYLPLVEQEKLAVISYYALASGFLSGKYRSKEDLGKSVRGQKAIQYLDDRGHRILAALDEVAAAHQVAPAQVAIAWQLHKPFITAPIVSATTEKQLAELAGSASLELSPEQVALLDQASAY